MNFLQSLPVRHFFPVIFSIKIRFWYYSSKVFKNNTYFFRVGMGIGWDDSHNLYHSSPFRACILNPHIFSEKWNKPQFDAETFPNGKQKPSPVEHFHFYVQILLHFTFDLPKEFCSLYFTLFRGKYFSDFCALHFGIQS